MMPRQKGWIGVADKSATWSEVSERRDNWVDIAVFEAALGIFAASAIVNSGTPCGGAFVKAGRSGRSGSVKWFEAQEVQRMYCSACTAAVGYCEIVKLPKLFNLGNIIRHLSLGQHFYQSLIVGGMHKFLAGKYGDCRNGSKRIHLPG